MNPEPPSLLKRSLAEFLGTYLLILFGCGVVHASVLTGRKADSGKWRSSGVSQSSCRSTRLVP